MARGLISTVSLFGRAPRTTLRSALVAAAVLLAPAVSAQEMLPASAAMGRLARELFEHKPLPVSLDLPPFRAAEGGFGDCDEELRDRLIEALKLEQGDAANTIVDRRIDIRLPLAMSSDGAAAARVAGRYGVDGDRRLWVEAQVVSRDRSVLAALPRTPVSGLVCRGERRSLADAVEAAARGAKANGLDLALTRTDPRVGDLVAITLRNEGAAQAGVLCLNIAADDSAQVLTPLRPNAPRLPQRGMLVWPRDFAASGGPAGPICFEREQADAILCLGLGERTPEPLARRWREAWPVGAAGPAELPSTAALELVGEALADPATVAAFLRYRVGRPASGSLDACGARAR